MTILSQVEKQQAHVRKLTAMLDATPTMVLEQAMAEIKGADRASCEDGAALLSEARDFLCRFCAFPDEHAAVAATLWAVHAHMIDHFHTTPRLGLLSPEPASGKTRVLEVLHLLVPGSMFCLSASPAAIFRTLANEQVTLLVDEVDAIFSRRGKDDSNEDLRALLNAGYKRGATIPRCVGPKHEVQHFQVHCATALAGLGDLPETVMSRAIAIRMRRRGPAEQVEPFRTREHEHVGHEIRDRVAAWAARVGADAGKAWPTLPAGIVDRPAECWEPLIAVADAAGGSWPELARAACIALCTGPKDHQVSLGVRLLGDLRRIFGDAIALHTETILERLCHGAAYGLGDDAPWSEIHGKPLGVRGLASMLKRYSVESIKVTVNGRSLQGYRREHLWDAWQRYLPSTPGQAELPELPESTAESTGIAVPQVPEIPQVRGSEGDTSAANGADPRYLTVTCSDCGFLDTGNICGSYEKLVVPDEPRQCARFVQAIRLPRTST